MLRHFTEQLSRWILRGAQFLRSKFIRRTFYSFAIVAVLFAVFVVAHPVGAQTDGMISQFANGLINGLSSLLVQIAAIFIQLTIFALKFFIEIAGYNNYIDADIVKLGWNMVRDVANMFFVVVLLVIAFGTILGLEQYEWKKTLVKLIMAAFLVNFSNLICQVIIDTAQVFTITFLNAVAGAAGGNLIKMFNLDEIYKISYVGADPNGLPIQLFGGAVMTVIFAGMAMFTVGAYLIVIIARMVVLWTLMILSPLAFLFSALPNTQSYAQEFWNEFIHHVIVAPVMVFFLWLAFATFGGGDVVQQNIEKNHPLIIDGGIVPITQATDTNNQALGASFSEAASWENMANFAVAIAFLWIGIERVQKLGVVGGGIVSGAISFGKNVATLASGYAVGRWLAKGGTGLVGRAFKSTGKGVYKAVLGNTVEIAKNRISREIEGWGSWRARGPNAVRVDKKKDAIGQIRKDEDGNYIDDKRNFVRQDEDGNWYQVEVKEGKPSDEWIYDIDKETGERYQAFKYGKDGRIQYESGENDRRGALQKMFYKRQQRLIKSRKMLEKVKKQKDVREQLIDKRVTAVPTYLMQKAEGKDPDAYDRVEQGMLEAEQMRSAAKTEEYKNLGKQLVLSSTRFKDGKFQDANKGTVEQMIAEHKEKSSRTEELVKSSQEKARKAFRDTAKGENIIKGKIQAQVELKSDEAQSNLAQSKIETKVVEANKGSIFDTIQAEKQAHTEAEKQELTRKELEREYAESKPGTAELLEEAGLKAALSANEATLKQLEAEAGRTAAKIPEVADFITERIVAEKLAEAAQAESKQTEIGIAAQFADLKSGRELTERIQRANAGSKASESQIASITDEVLRNAFENARSTIEESIEKWQASGSSDATVLSKMIEEKSKTDMFIASMRAAELAQVTAKERKVKEAQAVDAASDAVANLQKGKRMPSTALASVKDEVERSYSGQERADASQNAANTMFYLMSKGKDLSLSDRIEMLGSWGKVDNEAWNDDFADYMIRTIKTLAENPQSLSGQKKVIAEQMSHVAEELGLNFESYTNDAGAEKYRFEGGYNRRLSSMLQGLAVNGGDTDSIKAHIAISDFQKENADEYKRLGYWGTAKQLARDGKLGGASYTYEQFEKAYKDNQDYIQIAAKDFKENGGKNGHWESVLNQEYDDEAGMYRFNTESDAAGAVITEIGKRQLAETLKAQVHSYGTLDLNSFLMKMIDPKMFRALTAQMKEEYEVKGMNYRSLSRLFGYHESENQVRVVTKDVTKKDKRGNDVVVQQKFAQLGGERMRKDFLERNGQNQAVAAEKMDAHIIRDALLPMLEGNATAFTLMMRRLFNGHVNLDQAKHGTLNIKFESDAFGEVENFDQLAEKIRANKDLLGFSDSEMQNVEKELGRISEQFKQGVVMSRVATPRGAREDS